PSTYRWYLGQCGDSSKPIGGATSVSYLTGPLTTTVSYWVLVSNTAGSASSATAVINVLTLPSITQQPQSQPVNASQMATLSVARTDERRVGNQWYVRKSAGRSKPT